jgi:hypothetical protein
MITEIYASMFLWKKAASIKISPVTMDAAFLNFPKIRQGNYLEHIKKNSSLFCPEKLLQECY